jgi:uncharacterized protein (DUF849 family)
MASGNEQTLAMAGLNQAKVDKSIKMPVGFGVVDAVFREFDGKYKDEWKRRLISTEASIGTAEAWRLALQRFDSAAVMIAVEVCKNHFALPPDVHQFVGAVEAAIRNRAKDKPTRTPALARKALSNIRKTLPDQQGAA